MIVCMYHTYTWAFLRLSRSGIFPLAPVKFTTQISAKRCHRTGLYLQSPENLVRAVPGSVNAVASGILKCSIPFLATIALRAALDNRIEFGNDDAAGKIALFGLFFMKFSRQILGNISAKMGFPTVDNI